MNTFYDIEELKELGIRKIGKNIYISRKCSIYNPELITFGNNVRIDDFCILSGKITIGSFVHISAYCALYGRYGIELDDFTGLSPRCTIFSASDDFSGEYLIGPMVDDIYRNIDKGFVRINKYSQIGSNTIIMPNVTIGEGTVVGAMSFVNRSLDEWSIYAGIPAKFIKKRKKDLLNKANEQWKII